MTNDVVANTPLNIVCDFGGRRNPRNLTELSDALDELLSNKRVVASQFSSGGFGYRLDDKPDVGYYSVTGLSMIEYNSDDTAAIRIPVGLGFRLSNRIHRIDGQAYYPSIEVTGDHIKMVSMHVVRQSDVHNAPLMPYVRNMTITILRDID